MCISVSKCRGLGVLSKISPRKCFFLKQYFLVTSFYMSSGLCFKSKVLLSSKLSTLKVALPMY